MPENKGEVKYSLYQVPEEEEPETFDDCHNIIIIISPFLLFKYN